MSDSSKQRRRLEFPKLEMAITDAGQLVSYGYDQLGNWTLAQICCHLRLTVDASIDGYPRWMSLFAPVRPVFRWLLLPRILRGDSLSGLPTSSIYVPPQGLADAEELELLDASVRRFSQHTGRLHAHPGFGVADRAGLERIHAAHAAHHLGFLIAIEPSGDE